MEAAEGNFQPLVLSGPSGVGKGTLIAMLTKEFPALFSFSVSCTTRKPRVGEENGVHYHFVTVEEFLRRKELGEFVETNHVHGNYYGTLRSEISRIQTQCKICILDIDIGGAKQIHSSGLDSVFIFLLSPSSEELERRLRTRGTEDESALQTRLRNAEREIEEGRTMGELFKDVLVNDQLQESYAELKRILGKYYPQIRSG